jgi:predicted ester cyclase
MTNARDVILKHIDAFNGRDSDADPWAADAEFTAPGAQFSGRDTVIGFIAMLQEAFPDLRLEIEHLLTDGPAAAAEGIITGTHDGVFHPTAMSPRQDEPLRSGGRRFTSPRATR